MKMKTLINRKFFTFVYVLLVSVIFYGCMQEPTIKENKIIGFTLGGNVYTYTIDSCEYIGRLQGGDNSWAAHKGNCKFCANRSKK